MPLFPRRKNATYKGHEDGELGNNIRLSIKTDEAETAVGLGRRNCRDITVGGRWRDIGSPF
jgi:hypothetical protein